MIHQPFKGNILFMDNALQKTLLELGFTPNNAAVYLAIVQLGPCNAGPIVKATNLHRNIVYNSIQYLIVRKLVSEKVVKGRKIFSATSPETLAHEFEHKAELAQKLSIKMKELSKKEAEEIVIYQGRKEYISLLSGLLDDMPSGSIEYIFGTGNGRLMNKYIKSFSKSHLEKLKKSTSIVRIIAYEKHRERLEEDLQRLPARYEVRYLPYDLPDPRVLDVYPDLNIVLHNIYSEDGRSVTAIKMVNKLYTQECLELCKKLWEMAT